MTSNAFFGSKTSYTNGTTTITHFDSAISGSSNDTTNSNSKEIKLDKMNAILLDPLTSISPLDGRYWKTISSLSHYFSEFALLKYRVRVEIEYFIALCEIPLPQLKNFGKNGNDYKSKMRSWYKEFNENDASAIKIIEQTTNHDVKAVEYWIKGKFEESSFDVKSSEFIHFALTSNDINNTAVPLSTLEAIQGMYLPNLNLVVDKLRQLSIEWISVPMLARTHGQVATPTRVGKEIMVFVERLEKQIAMLNKLPYTVKFGGATGNFNAHHVAYPDINWIDFANRFVEQFNCQREIYTTQISHYDNIGALCDNLRRINIILIDLCRDMWSYVSLNYFKQKIIDEEVGSSAMPHKVNPIDFENAEGNMGVANSLFTHFASKLPISRLQRDLTDSTVLRNLGVPFGHTILSLNSLARGLNKIVINKDVIYQDLENNWMVIAEAIQTVLRREGFPKPYEALKKLTRVGQKITRQNMLDFIQNLGVSQSIKEELTQISPFNYIGIVPKPVSYIDENENKQ